VLDAARAARADVEVAVDAVDADVARADRLDRDVAARVGNRDVAGADTADFDAADRIEVQVARARPRDVDRSAHVAKDEIA